MTVIAWDGKTLASDRQAGNNGFKYPVTKIKKVRGHLLFCSGDFDMAQEMFDWFEKGADPEKYPAAARDEKFTTPLNIISPDKKILRYERNPYSHEIEHSFFAVGSGRDYALAAMHLGYTAKEAVEVTCALCDSCGLGIDTLTL